MKSKLHALFIASVSITVAATTSGFAATWTGATDASWATVGNWTDTAPDNVTAQAVLFDATSIANLTQTLNGSYTLTGITLGSPTGAVTVNNGTGTNTLTIGSGGIDMSAAGQNLTLNPNLVIGANQSWTVNGGRTLTGIAGSTVSSGSGVGNISMLQSGSGIATIVFNQNGNTGSGQTGWSGYSGNITVGANVKVQSQGQNAAAFGTGTITLAGGTIAQISGSWAWANNIDVTAASVIGTDASNGLGRQLKLIGNLTSANSSGLTFTNSTTGGTKTDDSGIILAGTAASTYTTTTISANSRVRVGGNATNSMTTTGASDAGTRGSLGSGDVTLSATTSELAFTKTDAHSVANKITGTGTVVIGGTTGAMAGTSTQVVTLSGANDYTGATTVKNGRLDLTGSLASAVTVTSGAKISGTGTTTGLLTLGSGGGIALAGGATTTSITASGATFSGSNVATFLAPPVLSTVYDVFTYGLGAVTTPENFSVPYRGTLSNDTFNQKYVFTAGEFGATRTWNTTTGTWAVNSGTNFIEGEQKFFAADHVVFGNIASDSTITLSGPIIPGSVTVNNAANAYIFTGTAISGASSLTKGGAGTLTLATANTYSGVTTLDAGGLQLGINTAFGSGSLTLNGGRLSSDSATARSIANAVTVGGTVTLGDATNNGVMTLTGSVNLGSLGHKITTVSAASIDGAALTLTGAGELEINGVSFTNNMQVGSSATGRSGATTLTSGNLIISTSISMFGTGAINLNGGAIGSFSTTGRDLGSNAVTIGGNVQIGGSSGGLSSGYVRFSGATDLGGSVREITAIATGVFASTGSGAIFTGVVSNGGITKSGAGIMTLTNNGNAFAGATTINAGNLAISTGALASSASVSLAASGAALSLGINGTTAINNLTGVSGAAIRSDFNISGVDGARTLQVTQTTAGDYAGSFTEGGSRPISLVKKGSATLTLSGTATGYVGTTRVEEGNLAVTGSLGATAVTVVSGTTLSGNGNLGGSLTIESGGTHALAVAATTGAQVTRTITGALDLSAVGDILSLTAVAAPAGGTYILATATGGITGTPETVNQSGVSGTFAINGNNLELTVTAVAGYSSWATTNGTAGTIDLDHDNDGVSNGVEYFLGGPSGNTTGFTALPGVTTVAGVRSVTWTKAATYTGSYNTDFVVETSTTLAAGSWATETLGVNVVIAGDNVTYTFPAGPVKTFARLKVTGP